MDWRNFMINTDDLALAGYRQIAVIDSGHGVTLVQHAASGRVYVKKVLDIYNAEVYGYLRDHHVRGTPEIVDVVEKDGTLTVIEEYVSGQTLREFLDNGNRFSRYEAAEIIVQLCKILEQLHSAKPPILHRDIKPSNVMLTSEGNIRLLDMNAARRADPEKTQDTRLIGTQGYAAPEQYGFGSSGIQTDLYAAGVLLCELVTGKLPKEALISSKNPGLFSKKTEPSAGDGKALPKSPASERKKLGGLAAIVRKCTRIDPKTRYKSARALREELEAYLDRSSGTGREKTYFQKYLPPGFRSGSPVNMLTASVGYIILVSLSLTFTAKDILPGLMTLIERILLFIFGAGIIFFSANYLDVWSVLQINRIRNPYLKTLAVLAADTLLAFISLIIMIVVVLSMS